MEREGRGEQHSSRSDRIAEFIKAHSDQIQDFIRLLAEEDDTTLSGEQKSEKLPDASDANDDAKNEAKQLMIKYYYDKDTCILTTKFNTMSDKCFSISHLPIDVLRLSTYSYQMLTDADVKTIGDMILYLHENDAMLQAYQSKNYQEIQSRFSDFMKENDYLTISSAYKHQSSLDYLIIKALMRDNVSYIKKIEKQNSNLREISEQKQTIIQKDRKIARLEKDIDTLKHKLLVLEQQNARFEKENICLKEKCDSCENADIEALRKELASVKAKLNKTKEEIKEYKKGEATKTLTELKKLKSENDRLKRENASLIKKIEDLSEKKADDNGYIQEMFDKFNLYQD